MKPITCLKDTCKLTGARWAAWVEPLGSDWGVLEQYGLNIRRRKSLLDFLSAKAVSSRVSGALVTGRVRSWRAGNKEQILECEIIYIFPNPDAGIVLLVGANQLDKTAQGFFRILAKTVRLQPALNSALFQLLDTFSLELNTQAAYDLPSVLNRIVQILAKSEVYKSVCIGLRYADVLRLEAIWPHEQALLGRKTSWNAGLMGQALEPESAFIVDDLHSGPFCELLPDDWQEKGSWIGLPLKVGKRVIGVFCLFSESVNIFTPRIVNRFMAIAAHIAPTIEIAMTLSETSLHLEKLALLNELATVASMGTGVDEVATRIVARLQRIFKTDLIAILLLSQDGKMLHEFGKSYRSDDPIVIPTANSLSGYVAETGQPFRSGDVAVVPRYLEWTPGVRSELAVPLKYRGQVIGVLNLESNELNAFSKRDEQLLVVIASQLAGLITNARLHDEARRRALNLNLVHQVIQTVIGLTEIEEIAQTATDLIAKYFNFDLAMLVLVDDDNECLELQGIGGTAAERITPGLCKPLDRGVAGAVCQDGISRLIDDVSREPLYEPIPGWDGGSEICVPLQDGDLVFGALIVEQSEKGAFAKHDLQMLESLAGVLGSVMINARSYQRLQVNLQHLYAVRETALDISADLDLDTLLRRATHRVRVLVGAKGAELGLVNDEKRIVEIKVSEVPWQNYLTRLEIPFGQGVAGIMAVHGETLVVDDYSNWEGALQLNSDPPFTAVAGVPLKYKDQVIGTLTIIHDVPGRGFVPSDIRLLELLAPQIAVSVRNACLYQELQALMKAEREAKDRLVRSARLVAVGELAAGVAHELNNPLTTVAGFVELVLDDLPPDSPHYSDLELVLKESRRAKDVVRQLLDFSHPRDEIQVQTDLNTLIADVVSLVRHLLHTSGINLKTDLQPDLPRIRANRDQIKQVLLNLVHNAIQAMPRGGTLSLQTQSLRRDDIPGVVMRARDTGQGIPPENIERLFEPFFTTRPPGQGTGLGLSVSYGIITNHGGVIEVESSLGNGSQFSIWLPLESNKAVI